MIFGGKLIINTVKFGATFRSNTSISYRNEFDIMYMKKILEKCGLSYYGFCEPLDKKLDIVEKIKKLKN